MSKCGENANHQQHPYSRGGEPEQKPARPRIYAGKHGSIIGGIGLGAHITGPIVQRRNRGIDLGAPKSETQKWRNYQHRPLLCRPLRGSTWLNRRANHARNLNKIATSYRALQKV